MFAWRPMNSNTWGRSSGTPRKAPRDLGSRPDVDDDFGGITSSTLAMHLGEQLEARHDVPFRRDAIKPTIVAALHDAPADLHVEFRAADFHRELGGQYVAMAGVGQPLFNGRMTRT